MSEIDYYELADGSPYAVPAGDPPPEPDANQISEGHFNELAAHQADQQVADRANAINKIATSAGLSEAEAKALFRG